MPCSWQKEDYFSQLMCSDKKSYTALEMLVDDLHAEKEKTVNTFLCHSGSEDFLWGLVRLLGNDTPRVAGNAAYILGTLAESELGCIRVLSLVQDGSSESSKILAHLTRMLTFDDSESVMNAAGTMGTLAESHEGREWILSEKCLPSTLEHITTLLHSENLWTASNAALVLARLSIAEEGCNKMLSHDHSQTILSKLIMSLGVDEAGRGMNAAFAIGRLCDMEQGRKRLLQLSDSERMISSLAKMLSCDDTGASKNACFALSCLATNSEGHSRLLNNVHSEEILKTLAVLLSAEDPETGWFAAMTLRTLASQPKGCLRLRDHSQVLPALKNVESKDNINSDLKEEAIITLEILKRLSKPGPPVITVIAGDRIKATWDPIVTKSGFPVRYQLFDGTKCVYTGKECSCEVYGLQPNSTYTYKLRAYTEGDESPFSDVVTIQTEESVPGPPHSVRILGATITQLKVGWEPPEVINGVLKGYHVYLNDKEIQHTTETNVILTGLTANTHYEIEVCASTSKGKGDRSGTIGTTSEIGAHAPSKPQVNVIGRNELFVSWTAPEVPLGRFNRYDVIMNDKIIYSGNDLNLPVRRLTPDTEYSFVVVALTSEGKFESKMSKKRTAKDEYDSARPPLYQPPTKKETIEETSKTPVTNPPLLLQKKRKSSARITSGKNPAKRVGTAKERAKSSTSYSSDQRPGSADGEGSQASSGEALTEKSVPQPSVSQLEPQRSSNTENTPQTTSHGRPIAEVKYEQPQSQPTPRPISRTRPVRPTQKTEKSPNNKVQQSVIMSTVSMQNNTNKGDNKSDNKIDNKGASKDESVEKSLDLSGKKIGSRNEKESAVPSNGIKVERSKTVLTGRDVRRTKYSDSNPSSRVSSETKLPEKSEVSNRNVKAIINDRSERLNHSAHSNKDITKSKLSDGNNSALERHNFETVVQPERMYKLTGSPDKGRNRDMNRDLRRQGNKEAALPKPSLPSQKYLEGGVHLDLQSNGRSTSSPRMQGESDWLTQVKRVSETYTRNMNPSTVIPNVAESTYYIDQQAPSQFFHRTNTYINSHSFGRRILDPIEERPIIKRPSVNTSLNGRSHTFDSLKEKHRTSKFSKSPQVFSHLLDTSTQVHNDPMDTIQQGTDTTLHMCQSSDISSSLTKLDSLKKTNRRYQPIMPFFKAGDPGKRPVGRRSLEKLQRSTTQSGKQAGVPIKSGHSLNFDEIPDTSSKLANKFIPMQLRTQPANLGIGQLQRVNTTLLGDSLSDNSVSFRRLEALTRSQTQIEIRSQQAQIPMENRRDLPLPASRESSRNNPGRRSLGGSPQKINKLGGVSNISQQKNKEPDSMLLQQSWGMNGATERGTLQNVR